MCVSELRNNNPVCTSIAVGAKTLAWPIREREDGIFIIALCSAISNPDWREELEREEEENEEEKEEGKEEEELIFPKKDAAFVRRPIVHSTGVDM